MTSFFAIDIDTFPKNAEGNTSWPQGDLYRLLCEYRALLPAYLWGDSITDLTVLVGISFGISIPFILFAFLIEPLKKVWIGFRYFWVKVLLLPLLYFLRLIMPGNGREFFTSLWEKVARSAGEHRPNVKERLRRVLERETRRGEAGADEMFDLFKKRFRHDAPQPLGDSDLSSSSEDEDSSDEDEWGVDVSEW